MDEVGNDGDQNARKGEPRRVWTAQRESPRLGQLRDLDVHIYSTGWEAKVFLKEGIGCTYP
jgi:hypothetical protein